MSMAQALVPLKDLAEAKTRLAGVLRPTARRALAQAMVEDVLGVLSTHPQIGRVALVSDDPCASLLAARYEIDNWSEQSLYGARDLARGLNSVVLAASERMLALAPGPLLVLHADLPLLCRGDISAILRRQELSRGLVIACDRHGTGSNVLAFDSASMPRFCFGADSCQRHLSVARDAGFPASVMRRQGTAIDVDDARDIAALLRVYTQPVGEHVDTRTANLLNSDGLGARLAHTLATLAQDDAAPGESGAQQ